MAPNRYALISIFCASILSHAFALQDLAQAERRRLVKSAKPAPPPADNFEDLFANLDMDQDGELSDDDVQAYGSTYEVSSSDMKVMEHFKENLDLDGDGHLMKDEIHVAYDEASERKARAKRGRLLKSGKPAPPPPYDFDDLWANLDIGQDEELSDDDIQAYGSKYEVPPSDMKVMEHFKENLDLDGDGHLMKHELWVAYIKAEHEQKGLLPEWMLGKKARAKRGRFLKSAKPAPPRPANFDDLWANLDMDQDGDFDEDDINAYTSEYEVSEDNMAELQGLKMIDMNGDGHVTKDEVRKAYEAPDDYE